MSLIAPKSACPSVQLPQAEEDLRQARRAAQYRVSPLAFYFPAFPGWMYIPHSALTGAVVRNSTLATTGCCGKQLPVMKLVLRWEGGSREFVVDPPRHMDTILELVRSARPELEIDNRRQ